ncbi:MAG: HAD superfamily hydrolase (TIGR01549 family) [Moritella sp.]
MLKNKLSGVIFDLDNTLVSSSLNFNQIRATLGCPPEINILDHVDSLPQQAQPNAKKMLIDYEIADAQQAEKLIGTDDLLNFLSRLNIPCAIVTRNCRQAALLKMSNNRIDVPLLLTREDHKAKPAPDALLYIAEHWQLAPENMLCVGDYLYDLQAAKNANMLSCLVTNGAVVDYANLANMVVSNLAELKQSLALSLQITTAPRT